MRFLELIDAKQTVAVSALWLGVLAGACVMEEGGPDVNDGSQPAPIARLREALTFHSSFDGVTDADFALGDPRIYTAPSYDELIKAETGIHGAGISLVATGPGPGFGTGLL